MVIMKKHGLKGDTLDYIWEDDVRLMHRIDITPTQPHWLPLLPRLPFEAVQGVAGHTLLACRSEYSKRLRQTSPCSIVRFDVID